MRSSAPRLFRFGRHPPAGRHIAAHVTDPRGGCWVKPKLNQSMAMVGILLLQVLAFGPLRGFDATRISVTGA